MLKAFEDEAARIAQDLAALQDEEITALLDNHGLLDSATPEQLEKLGYKLIHEIENGDGFLHTKKHTVTLYKMVDRTRWSTKVDFRNE